MVPQEGQLLRSRLAPHLMQCLAPTRAGSPHLVQFLGFDASGCGLGGASARAENTSDKITTSDTVAILFCPTSNSLGNSRSSSRVLNCSLSTESTKALMSPFSLGTAFRTLPRITPCESITWSPFNASSLEWASLVNAASVRLSTYFSQA